MIKKNKWFILLLFINMIVLVSLALFLTNERNERTIKENISKNLSKQNSIIVNQKKLNEKHRFSGKLVSNPNENSYILLEWDYDRENVINAELLMDNKLIATLSSEEYHKKIDVVDNQLLPESNVFKLKLNHKDGSETISTINVNAGYLYNQKYSVLKINDKVYLEFGYLTNKKTPVSTPKLISSEKLILKENKPHMQNQVGEFIENKYYYDIDISKYESGDFKELIVWKIESLNFEFSQYIEFAK